MTQQSRAIHRKLMPHLAEFAYQLALWAVAGHLLIGTVAGMPRVITELERVRALGEWGWLSDTWLSWFPLIYLISVLAASGALAFTTTRRAFRRRPNVSTKHRLAELTRISRAVFDAVQDVSWGQYCRLCDGDENSGHESHCEVPLLQTEVEMAEGFLSPHTTKGRRK